MERGSIRTLRLARALFEVVNNALRMETLNLVIDDTLIPRQSEKAPGSIIRHDHARKNNRPQFLLAQSWVTLDVSVQGSACRKYVLPIVSRLVLATGNRNKLTIALVRSLALVMMNSPFGCCPMPGSCGRVWCCRCCPERCESSVRRGAIPHYSCRPSYYSSVCADDPTYGIKMTRCDPGFAGNRSQTDTVWQGTVDSSAHRGCNGAFSERYTGARGRCSFYDADKQSWSKARLLLATETELSAEEILRLYARRWGIEPLFHNLKRWWGVNNLWQQKRIVLERWLQVRSTAWTLVQ